MRSKIILIISVLFSNVALSSQEIIKSETHQYNKTGNVSISSFRGGIDDAIGELKNKASLKGGSYFYISSLGTPGDSSHWSGTAVIYEKNDNSTKGY